MPGQLVLSDAGLLANLDALTASWAGQRFVGLLQNENEPQPWWTITQIEPVAFSGYDGPHPIIVWSAATLTGHVATAKAQPNVWTHNGGTSSSWVTGYYVVDSSGVLMWAALRPGNPVAMGSAGDIYTVTVSYSIRSRFPVSGSDV